MTIIFVFSTLNKSEKDKFLNLWGIDAPLSPQLDTNKETYNLNVIFQIFRRLNKITIGI